MCSTNPRNSPPSRIVTKCPHTLGRVVAFVVNVNEREDTVVQRVPLRNGRRPCVRSSHLHFAEIESRNNRSGRCTGSQLSAANSVSHWCYTRLVPTTRRRHAITETPPVEAALDELRRELGTDRVELGELIVLGAAAKLASIRAERETDSKLRRRLADRIRSRTLPVDVDAADLARQSWRANG